MEQSLCIQLLEQPEGFGYAPALGNYSSCVSCYLLLLLMIIGESAQLVCPG